MKGAIIGDMVGSRFEFHNLKSKKFKLFDVNCFPTDDSVMTIAVGNALMRWRDGEGDLGALAVEEMRKWGRKYPSAGYGGMFRNWLTTDNPQPYNSFGNGSAMRVSACGWVGETLDEVKAISKAVTEVTHNHPDGIKGAEATAVAVYLARTGTDIAEIRKYVSENYYPIDFTLDEIRDSYRFQSSCGGTVPQALEAFFEATDFIDAIRNAISIGGDSDTIGAITGAVAEAYWGIPGTAADEVRMRLKDDLYEVVQRFYARYRPSKK